MTTQDTVGTPFGVPINDLPRYGGPNRSVAFAEMKAGKLVGYKVGRTRHITMESLRRYLDAAVAAERAS